MCRLCLRHFSSTSEHVNGDYERDGSLEVGDHTESALSTSSIDAYVNRPREPLRLCSSETSGTSARIPTVMGGTTRYGLSCVVKGGFGHPVAGVYHSAFRCTATTSTLLIFRRCPVACLAAVGISRIDAAITSDLLPPRRCPAVCLADVGLSRI